VRIAVLRTGKRFGLSVNTIVKIRITQGLLSISFGYQNIQNCNILYNYLY